MNQVWQSFSEPVGVQILSPLIVLAQTPVANPAPINVFQGIDPNNLTNIVLRLLGALAILLIGWLIAGLVSGAVRSLLKRTDVDNRLAGMTASGHAQSDLKVESLVGAFVFWVIMILAVVAALNTLNLATVSTSLNTFLDQIFRFLPRLGSAAVLLAIAWIVATVVRALVIRTAQSFSLDERLSEHSPTDPLSPSPFLLSEAFGNALYWFVFLFFLPLILGVLDLQGPLQPVQNLLDQILAALPKIFTAVLIVAIAYVLGKVVAGLVTSLLTSIGFNNVFQWLGLPDPTTRVPYSSEFQTGEVLNEPISPKPTIRTPSEIAGVVVLVGILLVATVAAIDVLQFEALKLIAAQLLIVFSRILVGLLVFAVGLYFANLAYNLINSSGSRQANLLGQAARVSIIALVAAMALQQMGIAPDIVNLAFGLLLGAIAVAIALSFGLGGRDVAAEQLREWLKEFKR
ncbi:hypothetical protein C7B65_05765 [Phormidesmis priestleyi ULC007]|uniref:Uncharacterized protein n=1 Tax=Phormidesmis priestleyi ULC007 TaxID=1920490 RepID=A0A2T1DKD1_9CYAN|nr:mechanosensitive ion channel [Phormidesmis priestleyi]PSB20915.1 hypothetical protein C7B65_05765 [Phormidesmis priestleyi ULC007]PZO51870.1 MAG: hypothetical protein DCF14_07910 [Phormidesmis priestleyi]